MEYQGRITIVVPCFNPPGQWVDRVLDRMSALHALLPGVDWAFVLVNDGSSRGISAEDRFRIKQRFPYSIWLDLHENRGKGAALRTGVSVCGDGPCLFTDVDMPYTLDSMVAACVELINGANVVLGQRKATYYERVPWARMVISKAFRWVLRRVLGLPISDTQCGLKGFDQRGRALFLRTTIDRFLFDMEFVMLASREKGLRITPIEAQLDNGVRFSRMNYRILIRESVNFFKVILRFRV